MKLAVWGLLTLWASGCADEPQPQSAPLSVTEGDPCNWAWASCTDEDAILWCSNGYWINQTCDEYCASVGPGVGSGGCEVELGSASPTQVCACEPPATGCSPGQGACEDDDTISWCTDEWTWSLSSCTLVCEAQSLLSLGCDSIGDAAICLCSNTGTPCDGAPPVCADSDTLSACEGGIWVTVDCTELCGDVASCDPGASGGAMCACG